MSARELRRLRIARASEHRAAVEATRAALELLPLSGRRWLQVNCSLFPQGPGLPPYAPWRELQAALETWWAEDRFERFFFMRKPPGLRLRFQSRGLETRLAPALLPWLEEMEHQNAVRGFRVAVYEPERFRFGGAAGMRLAHDHFDRDSRAAVAWETLPEAERTLLPRRVFSLTAASDLMMRCVEDAAELWDIWRRLQNAVGVDAGRPAAPPDLVGARHAVNATPAFAATLTAAGAALLEGVCAANAETASALRAAYMRGAIEVGPRAWLAAVTIFHWNRFGLDAGDLRPLAAFALSVLDHEPGEESRP